MLARLQQGIAIALAGLALGWIGWTWPDAPGWTVGGLVVIATGHALFLGAEFMLMHRVNRSDPSPRATWPQLGRAWLGESLQAPRVFGWRQPFRTQAWPDQEVPAVAGVLPGELPGVVLVHGFFCNRAFWNPWLQRLHAAGQPHVAVTLEPVFGGIDDYAPLIDAAVRRLHAATGRPVRLVCHSMGGLAVRAWLQQPGAEAMVGQVVTLGTPHHGTWLGRFGTSRNARQMRPDSRWLQALASCEPASRRARFVCYFSNCDNIVFPARTATLEGADNRFVPGLAHVAMAFDARVMNEVLGRP